MHTDCDFKLKKCYEWVLIYWLAFILSHNARVKECFTYGVSRPSLRSAGKFPIIVDSPDVY
jgi:hypothetical protein